MTRIKEEHFPIAEEQIKEDSISVQVPQEGIMFGGMQLFLGMNVEALENDSCWYPAKIIGINESNHQVLIHFDGFNPRHDKWYDVLGTSIRPLEEGEVDPVDECGIPTRQSSSNTANDLGQTEDPSDDRDNNQVETQRKKMGILRNPKVLKVQKKKKNQILKGMSFAFEGCFKITNEKYVARLIKRNGGRCKKYITASVKYVIIGDDPDKSKLSKIRKLGITIITEEDFVRFAEKLKKPQGRVAGKKPPVTPKKEETEHDLVDQRSKENQGSGTNETPGSPLNERATMTGQQTGKSPLNIISVPLTSPLHVGGSLGKINAKSPNSVLKGSETSPCQISEVGSSKSLRKSRYRKQSMSNAQDSADSPSKDCSISGVQNCLAGLHIGNEGQQGNVPLARLVYKFGGKFATNITACLDYIIIGKNPRADRVEKAVSYGVKVIDENGLLQLIREISSTMLNESITKQPSNTDQSLINATNSSSNTNSKLEEMNVDQVVSKHEASSCKDKCNISNKSSNGSLDQNDPDHPTNRSLEANKTLTSVYSYGCNQSNQSESAMETSLNVGYDHRFGLVNGADQSNRLNKDNRQIDVPMNNPIGSPNRVNHASQNNLVAKINKKAALVKANKAKKKPLLNKRKTVETVKNVGSANVAASSPSKSASTMNNAPKKHGPTDREVDERSDSFQIESSLEYLTINIQCPKKCGVVIDRNQLQVHLENDCQNTESECHICGFKMLRRDVDDHISRNIVRHMKLLGTDIKTGISLHANFVSENVNLVKRLDELQGRVSSLEHERKRWKELCKKLQKQNIFLAGQMDKLKNKYTS